MKVDISSTYARYTDKNNEQQFVKMIAPDGISWKQMEELLAKELSIEVESIFEIGVVNENNCTIEEIAAPNMELK